MTAETMTIKAKKFTPETLLSAPRRSSGVPNSDASQIIYTFSKYSFDDHVETREIRLLDPNSSDESSTLITNAKGASEPHWLDDSLIVLLEPGDKGATDVVVGDVSDFDKTKYIAGTIDAAANDIRVKKAGKDKFIFAFAASTTPEGALYNPDTAPTSHTSGMVYSSLFVRHWDHYTTRNRNSIWYSTLELHDSRYKLGELTNALNGTGLSSPIDQATGGDVNYDIGPYGLAFVAKDPHQNPANNTKQNLYLATADKSGGFKQPEKLDLPGFNGACSNTYLSQDGKSLVFTVQRQNGYEADKNQIFIVPDIEDFAAFKSLSATANSDEGWDRSPSSFAWSPDAQYIYAVAEDEGTDAIFKISVYSAEPSLQKVFGEGSLSTIEVLESGKLFFSTTTLVDNSAFHLLDTSDSTIHNTILSSNSRSGANFGLSLSQVSEIRYAGAEAEIQAFVVKPSAFDASKKYPVAFIIHGGPQGAWTNAWSTRWNLAMFAEQGYIVVAPNPTGSSGFGQKLTDAIQGQWGGLPYQDIVKCVDYVGERFTFVDMGRAVALGASYGGYMANWIQGNDLGRRFKALVTHDGVFSMTGQLASDELFFPEHEFGGRYWENTEGWLKWDPAQFAGNWDTPHLIIHSEKDYRLTISEGLSAFNVLQERGVPSKFLVFPDENHWVLKPENSLLWHTVVLDWINGFVGLPKYSSTSDYAAQLLKEANQSV